MINFVYQIDLEDFRMNRPRPERIDKFRNRNFRWISHVGLRHEEVEVNLRRDDVHQQARRLVGIVKI